MYTFETYKWRPDRTNKENEIPEADVKQLVELFIDGMRERFKKIPNNADYERFTHLYAAGQLMVCALKKENKIYGVSIVEIFGTWHNRASEIFRLTSVYLKPELRNTSAAIRLYDYTLKEGKKYADAARDINDFEPRLLIDIDTNEHYESLLHITQRYKPKKISEVWELPYGIER